MAKNILICDDAAFMRMMIKDILTKNGYVVVGEAENGLKAVEKYNETKPDLVLMDITMPEMDGIQALKKIKEGDFISIDGSTGKIYLGDVKTSDAKISGNFERIMKWQH